MVKQMKKNLVYLGVIFVVAFFTMMPMFTSEYKSSHDTKFHLANIDSLTEQIKDDFLFPSKIVGRIGNDFGYGTELFYPPLSHYSTAYINVIFNNPVISIKIVHFLGLFLLGITMFFLAKRLSDNSEIGLLSAIIYMLFPYHLSNIYIRDALGESLFFVFLPLIFLGLYELFNDNLKKFYPLFIVGYVFAMLSHLIMTAYLTVIILVFLIVKYKKTLKYLKPLIIAALFILTITSPYTVGLLQQKILGNYNVFVDGVMVQGTWGNALNPFDYILVFKNMGNSEIKFYIDIIVLIMLFLTFKNYKKYNNKYYNYILVFGIVCFILSSQIFPWDILPKSLRLIQFPWRFVTFISLVVSLLAPLCLCNFKDKKVLSLILIIVMLLLAQPNLRQATNEVINVDNLEYWYGVGVQREYTPVNTVNNLDYYDNRSQDILIKEGEGTVNLIINKVPYLEFEVTGQVTVELPRLYYIGYTLIDSNNNKVNIYENEKGFIETKVSEGTYKLDFTGTTFDKVASVVSFLSCLTLVVFVWRKK